MISLSVKTDIAQVLKQFDNSLGERQWPFVIAKALTSTAQEVKKGLQPEMTKAFDRPTPFTLNSLMLTPATKQNLEARVWLKDFAGKGTPASKYLLPQIYGGNRKHKGFENILIRSGIMPDNMFAVPSANAPLDQYGNMRGSFITRVLSYIKAFSEVGYIANRTKKTTARKTQQYFVVNPSNRVEGRSGKPLPYGIYERNSRGIKLIIAFVKQPKYQIRFKFGELANAIVAQNFRPKLSAAIEYAIQTSKGK